MDRASLRVNAHEEGEFSAGVAEVGHGQVDADVAVSRRVSGVQEVGLEFFKAGQDVDEVELEEGS